MAEIVAPQNVENPGEDPRWLGMAESLNGPVYGTNGWAARPYLTSSDMTVYRNKDMFAADARDASRTNPYARSAKRTSVDSIIGTTMTLSLQPISEILGVTDQEAQDWAEMVENKWAIAAESPDCHFDAQRKQTFTGLMRETYSGFYTSGESLGTIEWKASSNGQRTCYLNIEPERLSDPRGQHDIIHGRRMGVERDRHGAPIGYHIRERHPSDGAFWGPIDFHKWKYVPRRNSWGRWQCLHYFEQDRPDMTRGISAFTTALLPMRLLQDYMTTELESAAVRATYAAVIQSELNYEEAMKVVGDEYANTMKGNPMLDFTMRRMADSAAFYRGQDMRFGKAKISHLLPNEELKMVQGTQHANGLKDYADQNLHLLASSLGVDYASLTKDYAKVNYSGARAALYDVWRSYEVRREEFVDAVAWPIFVCWLEEMVALREQIPMLGNRSFYDVRDALTYGTFETWTKPRLDPLKEGQADLIMYNAGALSLRDLAKQEGRDWRRVLNDRAQEKAEMKKLGLTPEDIDWTLIMNAGAKNKPKADNADDSQQ